MTQIKCSNKECNKEYNHEKNCEDNYSSFSKCPYCETKNMVVKE